MAPVRSALIARAPLEILIFKRISTNLSQNEDKESIDSSKKDESLRPKLKESWNNVYQLLYGECRFKQGGWYVEKMGKIQVFPLSYYDNNDGICSTGLG